MISLNRRHHKVWCTAITKAEFHNHASGWLISNIPPDKYALRILMPGHAGGHVEVYFEDQRLLSLFTKYLKTMSQYPAEHKPSSLIKQRVKRPDRGQIRFCIIVKTFAKSTFDLTKVAIVKDLMPLLETVPAHHFRHERSVILELVVPEYEDEPYEYKILYKWDQKKESWFLQREKQS